MYEAGTNKFDGAKETIFFIAHSDRYRKSGSFVENKNG